MTGLTAISRDNLGCKHFVLLKKTISALSQIRQLFYFQSYVVVVLFLTAFFWQLLFHPETQVLKHFDLPRTLSPCNNHRDSNFHF